MTDLIHPSQRTIQSDDAFRYPNYYTDPYRLYKLDLYRITQSPLIYISNDFFGASTEQIERCQIILKCLLSAAEGKDYDVSNITINKCFNNFFGANAGANNSLRQFGISPKLLDALSDDELPIVVGHELAHLLLGHKEYGNCVSRNHEMEFAADELGLRLVLAAGYPVTLDTIKDYFTKLALENDLAVSSLSPTHPPIEARVLKMISVLEAIGLLAN